ncbi:hypothetical protein BDY21DRAFT_213454 [Lineolata rhizophorae]|uniref:Uncharacterized protein n=1 Tax=Lineolata rhizophorae TaxID=578093 RepID=A0A6A6P2C0_9PEZI|nr:hypothetical protein BDY21DRAFT_213454 [Lineolata rhizophorae]
MAASLSTGAPSTRDLSSAGSLATPPFLASLATCFEPWFDPLGSNCGMFHARLAQHPPLGSTGKAPPATTPTVPSSSFIERPEAPTRDEYAADALAFSASSKRRKSTKVPAELARSVSTPHMRGLAQAESGATSPTTNKQRNKLGYHRTSVACGE